MPDKLFKKWRLIQKEYKSEETQLTMPYEEKKKVKRRKLLKVKKKKKKT